MTVEEKAIAGGVSWEMPEFDIFDTKSGKQLSHYYKYLTETLTAILA